MEDGRALLMGFLARMEDRIAWGERAPYAFGARSTRRYLKTQVRALRAAIARCEAGEEV